MISFFRNYYSMFGFVGFLLVISTVAILAYVRIKDHIRMKKQNRQWEEELNAPVQLPDVDSVYAVITAKDVVMEKGHFPSSPQLTHRLNYLLEFLTDYGNTVQYSVPQELYEYVHTGQRGILATIEGEFFDFGNGEDIQ